MSPKRVFWTGGILLALQLVASAQLAFDVASIKENKALGTGGSMQLMAGGGLRAQHLPASALITIAYRVQRFQLIGAPDWIRDTYYDVIAKPAEARTREQTFDMLQALLADRFKLAAHRDNRQVDGFALVRLRRNALGPDMRPSSVDCEQAFSTTPRCKEGRITSASMKAIGVPMWSLLQLIIGEVGAPVSDDTGLTGTFDVDLRWSHEAAPSDDLRSIFTALQEQLGLKLERRRVTADMLIVDHIERPSPD